MTAPPSPQHISISVPHFIKYSIRSPIRMFIDPNTNFQWDYGDGGPEAATKVILIIPTIYENTHTSYILASQLVGMGYRVIVTTIPTSSAFSQISGSFGPFPVVTFFENRFNR
jgi:hypothetical protein